MSKERKIVDYMAEYFGFCLPEHYVAECAACQARNLCKVIDEERTAHWVSKFRAEREADEPGHAG